MKISEAERRAIIEVLEHGKAWGYGNLISHLETAWAAKLMESWDLPEKAAREAARGPGYPFQMQRDLIERGEWDETGARYRT
jgi:hypothetical protein